jgi:hypothetical protein
MKALLLLATCATALGGCARVQPWQRGHLARPAMLVADDGVAAGYRAKVLESKTAGGLPGSAPGGGCGCTQ